MPNSSSRRGRSTRRMTIWSHPAFAMKSVFARNDKEIVRVSLAADKASLSQAAPDPSHVHK